MKLMPMERVTTQTLLGIQFWDPATGHPVVEGLRVKAQRLSGKVARITVTNQGRDYTQAPTVILSDGGNPAIGIATATLTGDKVTKIDVTHQGSGYTKPPEVFLLGGNGTGATAEATLAADKVAKINVTHHGIGYTQVPTVILSDGGNPAIGIATATLTGDKVTKIDVTHQGSGYTSTPSVEITGGDGKGATAEATIAAIAGDRIGCSIIGRATPSGVIAFFGLVLEERVKDDPNQQIWQSKLPLCLIAIDVEDTQRRYLPMSFVVEMPHKGACKVDLWSAPSRPVPSALAVIQAQIAIDNDENPAPAAYALVEVTIPNQGGAAPKVHRGLTNDKGTLLLPLPYPQVVAPVALEGFKYPALDKQTFDLTITVRYENTNKLLAGSDMPNLEAILSQKPANIITQLNQEQESSKSMSAVLRFDQPLMLRTKITDQKMDSYLRLSPNNL
jgi:hypothetical protein